MRGHLVSVRGELFWAVYGEFRVAAVSEETRSSGSEGAEAQ
jgi:hypothetical protein